ncbi:MAG TPA: glutamyl-tRNA reductase [Gammaproteobacteria bacterium]
MPLLALGLNHKTAPVALREQTSFAPEEIVLALQGLAALPAVNEAAIISTCNRTEIYCWLEQDDHSPALQWFLEHHGLQPQSPGDFLYHYIDSHTVRHLMRVACGLDSMVLGEPQILGQLKAAYRQAEEAGTIGLQLRRLFEHTFTVAKQVRSETAIGANPVSIAFAAVRLAHQIFSDLQRQTALLIGAGETIELAARHLRENGIGQIIIANRTLERGRRLALQFNAKAIRLSELPAYLPAADILITSTASQLPIIGKGAVESALKERKHRPMLIVDIAVPRDVEPEVEQMHDVYLYNIDDLQSVIEANLQSRAEAAKQAETIIAQRVEDFMNWQRSLNAVHTIRSYREQAKLTGQEVLEKAKRLLQSGKTPEHALEYLAHTLTNKLLHNTTARLDQAARDGRQDLLEAAHEILNPANPKK